MARQKPDYANATFNNVSNDADFKKKDINNDSEKDKKNTNNMNDDSNNASNGDIDDNGNIITGINEVVDDDTESDTENDNGNTNNNNDENKDDDGKPSNIEDNVIIDKNGKPIEKGTYAEILKQKKLQEEKNKKRDYIGVYLDDDIAAAMKKIKKVGGKGSQSYTVNLALREFLTREGFL